jgi:hypothetical protein
MKKQAKEKLPIPNNDMNSIFSFTPSAFASLGFLGAYSGALALRMSLYRLAGSPGEGNPNSPLERFSVQQLLNAEWAPVGAFLSLALVQQGSASRSSVDLLTAAFVASRVLFLAAHYVPKALEEPLDIVAMSTTYLTTFAMSGMLMYNQVK